jgi:hypothetical protein
VHDAAALMLQDNEHRIRNVAAGTTRKSTDARHSKWFRRKARQVGDGG